MSRSSQILTAASAGYADQVVALIGSIRSNWPGAPGVTVFDLGLSKDTVDTIRRSGATVVVVPEFCPHWRLHYTWKLWCLASVDYDVVLWLDAGCCVLRPLDDIIAITGSLGYFAIPNHCSLADEASLEACNGCGVSPEFREGKHTIAAGIFGFARNTPAHGAVKRAFQVSLSEQAIRATSPRHRWEQAILSLEMYKAVSPLVLCDGLVYAFDFADRSVPHKAIWAARRGMARSDLEELMRRALAPNGEYQPRVRPSVSRLRVKFSERKQRIVAALFGYKGKGVRD